MKPTDHRQLIRLAFAAAAAVAGCGGDTPSAPPPAALIEAPVIYDEDDRVDWYAVTDPELSALARDVSAAMIDWDELTLGDEGVTLDPTLPYGVSHGLCEGERFWDQQSHASCSGTLIDEQLVLTAGHCVASLSDCGGSAWVFDYLYTADGSDIPVDPDDVYACVDIVAHGWRHHPDEIDFAVIQLDRPVADRTPATMRAPGPLSDGDPLVMTGFPSGIPLKVDAGGAVTDASDNGGLAFTASVDAFSGNSGSGVFDANLQVAGILSNGETDFDFSGGCYVVNVLSGQQGDESVVYAHHAATTLCERGFPSAHLCGEDAATASCGDGFCTTGETQDSCAEDCSGGLFGAPDGWLCNAAWYNVDDDCDCDCGILDPDCDNAALEVLNCAPGSACLPDGSCEVPFPEDWYCNSDWYGAGDDCDCDCGAWDPDCDDPSLDVYNCAHGSACNPDGTCVEPFPAGWDCRRRYYAAGDDCDCECGAYDPDCDDPGLEILNCGAGQVCGEGGQCVSPPESPADPGPEPGPEPTPEPTPEPAHAEPSSDTTGAEPSGTPPVGTQGAVASDDGCHGGGLPGLPLAVFAVVVLSLWRRRHNPAPTRQ